MCGSNDCLYYYPDKDDDGYSEEIGVLITRSQTDVIPIIDSGGTRRTLGEVSNFRIGLTRFIIIIIIIIINITIIIIIDQKWFLKT